MNIFELFKNLLDSLMSGSFERLKVINGMNDAFREYYYSGELPFYCHVSISAGDPSFKHEMSSFFFRSGFKLLIENDTNIKGRDIAELSKYILSNQAFVRQLMSIGFDTLIIQGKTTLVGEKYELKKYGNLNQYYVE